MGSRPHSSSGRSAAPLQTRKTRRPPKRRTQTARGQQTSLIDISDALATICATVNVAAAALSKDENEALATNAGQVLHEHVYEPLSKQRHVIEAHAQDRHAGRLTRARPKRKGE